MRIAATAATVPGRGPGAFTAGGGALALIAGVPAGGALAGLVVPAVAGPNWEASVVMSKVLVVCGYTGTRRKYS